VPCILVVCAVGILLGGLHRWPSISVPKRFFGYMSFCLLQQVALNSYSTNRLLVATKSPARASLISGTIFGALHWPILCWFRSPGLAGPRCPGSSPANATFSANSLSSYSWCLVSWAFPVACNMACASDRLLFFLPVMVGGIYKCKWP